MGVERKYQQLISDLHPFDGGSPDGKGLGAIIGWGISSDTAMQVATAYQLKRIADALENLAAPATPKE